MVSLLNESFNGSVNFLSLYGSKRGNNITMIIELRKMYFMLNENVH